MHTVEMNAFRNSDINLFLLDSISSMLQIQGSSEYDVPFYKSDRFAKFIF